MLPNVITEGRSIQKRITKILGGSCGWFVNNQYSPEFVNIKHENVEQWIAGTWRYGTRLDFNPVEAGSIPAVPFGDGNSNPRKVGDPLILDRLYTPDGKDLATNWLWENASNLFDPANLPEAAAVASYLAWYLGKSYVPAQPPGKTVVMFTNEEDIPLLERCQEICERAGETVSEPGVAQGPLAGLVAQAMLRLARKLLDELLNQ